MPLPTYDFSAPYVAARIIDRNGDSFPLWTNVGGSEASRPTVPGAEDLQALAFVQEVQVENQLGDVPIITVQMSPPFREGMQFINSHLADSGSQNRIEVQLGYSSGTGGRGAVLTPPFIGTLLHPDISIGEDVQITLKGQGLGGYSASAQPGRVTGRTSELRRELIKRIARGAGRIMYVNFDLADQDQTAAQALNEEAAGFVQGGRTDWMALWELAQRTRCWMSLVGDTLHWIPRIKRFSEPPTRTYRLYDYPGGRIRGAMTRIAQQGELSSADLPIINFTCSTEGVWENLQHGAEIRGVSDETRQEEAREITVEGLAEPVGAGVGVQSIVNPSDFPYDINTGVGAGIIPGNPDDFELIARAEDEVAEEGHIGIEVEVETLGDPDIMPGAVVRLAGLGRRFDEAVYAVFGVVHSIGVSGYSTNVVLKTNIDPEILQQEGGRAPAGTPNTAETEQQESYVAVGDVDPEIISRPPL